MLDEEKDEKENEEEKSAMDVAEEKEFLKEVARALDELFVQMYEKRMGFYLAVYEFNKPGVTNYISNSDRKDIMIALEETLERFKKNEVIPAPINSMPI